MQVADHPVIDMIVKLRALLEKCRPIDSKLKYQIDKLVARPVGEAAAAAADSALAHRPRPGALVDEESDGEDDTAAGAGDVYVAPRLGAQRYDDGKAAHKAERKSAAAKNRAMRSSLLHEMQRELSEAPEELKAEEDRDRRGKVARIMKKAEERQNYEEENFVRLALTKQDKKDANTTQARPAENSRLGLCSARS